MMAEARALELPNGDDDSEDNDDTIVTTARVEPTNNPVSGFEAPVPAAGKPATISPPAGGFKRVPAPRENTTFAVPPRTVPPRAHAPATLPPVVVAAPAAAPRVDGGDQRSRPM